MTNVSKTHLRQQQVEQTPELLELILQWRAGQQEAALGDEPVQIPSQLALPVLHALGLINDHVLPFHLWNAHPWSEQMQQWTARRLMRQWAPQNICYVQEQGSVGVYWC